VLVVTRLSPSSLISLERMTIERYFVSITVPTGSNALPPHNWHH
jgi:hypothetical protein